MKVTNAPIRFVYSNIVWNQARDPWAIYRVPMIAYEGLSNNEKIRLLKKWMLWATEIRADFQLLRLMVPWSLDEYRRTANTVFARGGDPELWRAHLQTQLEMLAKRQIYRPQLYVSVNLRSGDQTKLSGFSMEFQRLLRGRESFSLSESHLEGLLGSEARVFEKFSNLGARRVDSSEVQLLCRHSFCRGLPAVEWDEHWRAQAIKLVDKKGDGIWKPLEADVLRLFDVPIERKRNMLCVRPEGAEIYQTLFALGALPTSTPVPSRQAELFFAPIESLKFPVDIALNVKYLPKDEAHVLVQRKLMDSDVLAREAKRSEHGADSETLVRPKLARELRNDVINSPERPPLYRGHFAIAAHANTPDELEDRVHRLRSAFTPIAVHRPEGGQIQIFRSMLPGQDPGYPVYDDLFTTKQIGSFVPSASITSGKETGLYVGDTLSASKQPVRIDLRDASRNNRPTAIVMWGTLGSGKTAATQYLTYGFTCAGSRGVIFDPKGDNHFAQLPGMAERTQTITIEASERWRGTLDPFVVAEDGTEFDAAVDWLLMLLWRADQNRQDAVRNAVAAVLKRAKKENRKGSCCEVIDELLESNNAAANSAGQQLQNQSEHGLALLGFARKDQGISSISDAQVSILRIRNLRLPKAGTPMDDMSEAERTSRALVRLASNFAMRLLINGSGHKWLDIDESAILTEDSQGQAATERFLRWGRSLGVTVLLLFQLLRDLADWSNVVAEMYVFGQEDPESAKNAAALLGRPGDEAIIQKLLTYRHGRCLYRDLDGNVTPVRIAIPDKYLEVLDTSADLGDLESSERDALLAT